MINPENLKQKRNSGIGIGLVLIALCAGLAMCTGRTRQTTFQEPTPMILAADDGQIAAALPWAHCVAIFHGDTDPRTADTALDARRKIIRKNGMQLLVDVYNPNGNMLADNATANELEELGNLINQSEVCPDGVPFSSLDP